MPGTGRPTQRRRRPVRCLAAPSSPRISSLPVELTGSIDPSRRKVYGPARRPPQQAAGEAPGRWPIAGTGAPAEMTRPQRRQLDLMGGAIAADALDQGR